MNLTISLKALAAGDDAGTSPGVGDEVDFTVTGKVASVTGGNASVEIMTANGQPVADAKAPAAEQPADLTDKDMQAMSAKADEDGGSMN